MRVLVTGGAGYIGSIAVERLIKKGHHVVVVDDLSRGHRAAVHPNASFDLCDLRDAEAMRSTVVRHDADAIMHFAAMTLVGESVNQPAEYFRTNVQGGLNLLEAARVSGIKRFIFSSTAAVYGEPERVPILEEDVKRPINPYGQTKWIMEQALSSYANAYGVNYAAFRYFNVAGASQNYGEDHRPETHIIPLALSAIESKDRHFTINGTDYPTPDGTAIRDYVHVIDLADAHIAALERLDQPLGAINLGTKEGFSVQDIVAAIEAVTGRSLMVTYGPRRSGDPAALVADAARARDVLDWEPLRSTLDKMISSAWEWHKRNPNGYRD